MRGDHADLRGFDPGIVTGLAAWDARNAALRETLWMLPPERLKDSFGRALSSRGDRRYHEDDVMSLLGLASATHEPRRGKPIATDAEPMAG